MNSIVSSVILLWHNSVAVFGPILTKFANRQNSLVTCFMMKCLMLGLINWIPNWIAFSYEQILIETAIHLTTCIFVCPLSPLSSLSAVRYLLSPLSLSSPLLYKMTFNLYAWGSGEYRYRPITANGWILMKARPIYQ